MNKILTLVIFVFTFHICIQASCCHGADSPIAKADSKRAVTYELSAGRFGDKLLCYLHAKWISYKYDIPLLYKPFNYSDQLLMHHLETKFTYPDLSRYQQIIKPWYGMNVNYAEDKSVLYIIPYFPENLWEHTPQSGWYYFKVDWDDPGFKKLIRKMIKPLYVRPALDLPSDRISIAVHVRKGGGFDTPDTWRSIPLKMPPDSFYIDQIRRMIDIFDDQPLYVYIFTDDQNPQAIVNKYQSQFEGVDIKFDCRAVGNHHASNVLEDFFEMMRFDCLIRPDSNFSLIASKVAKYKVIISPLHFKWMGDTGFVDEVDVEFTEEFKGANAKERIHVLD